ncbi:hypothetical protein LTR28_010270, partial [Elasticomyces elasticus]
MFGSSASQGKDDTAIDTSAPSDRPLSSGGDIRTKSPEEDKALTMTRSPATRVSQEESSPTAEKKRRSSGVAKARDMFSNARQSLSGALSPSPDYRHPQDRTPQTAMQKLGRTDPALTVPQ